MKKHKSFDFAWLVDDDNWSQKKFENMRDKCIEEAGNDAYHHYLKNYRYWLRRDGHWGTGPDAFCETLQNDVPCYSIKAAKRYLRKHTEIPKGMGFWLISVRGENCDVYLTKR